MHTIRLRGPWELQPVARFERQAEGVYRAVSDSLPPGLRAKMPANWGALLGQDFLGRVRFRRNFQKPTGLDAGERVWLVVEPPRSWGAVHLNATVLGTVHFGGPPARFDITEQLCESNRLEILVHHPALDDAGAAHDDSTTPPAGGLIGEVRLEIEE